MINMDILEALPDRTIVSTRTVNASVEEVFRAWTDPEHLKIWWGPNGFTNTFHEHDLRPGGRWKYVMHGPEKGNYNNECVFLKIEKPHLIAWDRISQPHFQVLAQFEKESENRTKITWKMIFRTPEEKDKLIKYVPEKNEENLNRLEEELKKMKA